MGQAYTFKSPVEIAEELCLVLHSCPSLFPLLTGGALEIAPNPSTSQIAASMASNPAIQRAPKLQSIRATPS
jgi:hypothetical protein